MCPLGARDRYAGASLGGYLTGTVPGAAKVELPAEDPDQEWELQGGNRGERLVTAAGTKDAAPRQLTTQACMPGRIVV